jgi:putative phosphoesterase
MGAVVKVAVISDIHGNLPALQAVLSDMPPIDMIVCCGDVVGYYPDINEVCALLRRINVFAVRGNHDAYITGELQPDPSKAIVYRTEWTRRQLDLIHLQWLKSLPIEMRFQWDHLTLIVRHASPWDEETYLYADSPGLVKIPVEKNEMLILGHTHHSMLKKVGDGIVLNPGSVGQPRDWNEQGSYAIVETMSKNTEIRRVAYDVRAFQKRLKSLSWDRAAIEILSRRR